MTSANRARPYHSPARQEQARATHDAIAAGAAELFRKRGYRATTIQAIADRAGVAAQTVYAIFGSKRGILVELVHKAKLQAAVGPTFRELIEEADPRRALGLTVDITTRWAEASLDLVDLVRAEAGSDPDVEEAWRSAEESRLAGNEAVIRQLRRRGTLRRGLSVSVATDLLWALESTDLYRLLVRERDWTSQAYATKLRAILEAVLLEP